MSTYGTRRPGESVDDYADRVFSGTDTGGSNDVTGTVDSGNNSMSYDPIQNQTGELRRRAGGSDTGTSTGAAIVGTADPLAGLNAATPGLDRAPNADVFREAVPQMPNVGGVEVPMDTADGLDFGVVGTVLAVAAVVWVILRG